MATRRANISPEAIIILYTGPRNFKTLSVPVSPSITISRLPKMITQNPQKTRAWNKPITGRRNIFVCPKATVSITFILLPKSLTGNAGLVNLKNLTIRFMVYENAPNVIRSDKVKTICFVIFTNSVYFPKSLIYH